MKFAAVDAADKSRIRALLQLLQGAREGPAPAPPTSSVARAIYLGRVLASIPGRRVMLCDRARVICRATRTPVGAE